MIFTGLRQDDIPTLPDLEQDRYENIFNIYTTKAGTDNLYYYYNILNKVQIPNSLDQRIFDTKKLNRKLPWTTFSYQLYETMNLWWLIFLINKPKNIFIADAGIEYKYIRREYIDEVITSILSQINV
jgi:hypothetical protein